MWAIVAVLSAFFLSIRDISTKSSKVTGLKSAYFTLLIIQPLSLIIIYNEFQWFEFELLTVLLIASLLDSLAIVAYSYAIKAGKVSESAPILCFIPVFQLGINFWWYGGVPSFLSLFGVILSIVFVMYSYKFNVKNMLSNLSSLLMVCVAFCWSISSMFHKNGAQALGPILWTCLVVSTSFVLVTFYILIFTKENLSTEGIQMNIVTSLAHFMTLITFYWASSLGNVAFVSVIRRLSALFSALFSTILLKETVSNRQWIGIVGVMLGASLVVLGV
ncbi:EamA family transporter [Aliivibrio sifiae]|uniref:EamA domain-containing protein n=1 Tax=Aliivibrio sifiae TaxID=566293 RepID=A0A2S7XCH8_9GAMM|nr:EamA family transporter [Aliivibrio sifiae]PQJ89059.1 hypothetical protein BTO22_05440 [Aliivibrio sifiae]